MAMQMRLAIGTATATTDGDGNDRVEQPAILPGAPTTDDVSDQATVEATGLWQCDRCGTWVLGNLCGWCKRREADQRRATASRELVSA